MTDTVLLDRLQHGDTDGLTQLYSRYHQRVLRYCIRLLNDRQHAEDIVQDVFLKLHSCRHTIRNGQSIQSWLYTVARNEAYTEMHNDRTVELDDSLICEDVGPEDDLMSKERDEVIAMMLGRMYLPFREVLVLRIYEQLSYEEIAAITGTTVSSVKSRLFKARKALIKKLNPYFTERLL